jgi:hypothetical protein
LRSVELVIASTMQAVTVLCPRDTVIGATPVWQAKCASAGTAQHRSGDDARSQLQDDTAAGGALVMANATSVTWTSGEQFSVGAMPRSYRVTPGILVRGERQTARHPTLRLRGL